MTATYKRILALLRGFLTTMDNRPWEIALSCAWALIGTLLLFEPYLRTTGLFMVAWAGIRETMSFFRGRKSEDGNTEATNTKPPLSLINLVMGLVMGVIVVFAILLAVPHEHWPSFLRNSKSFRHFTCDVFKEACADGDVHPAGLPYAD